MTSTTQNDMRHQRQFLRRGEQNNTDFLPVEPSFVFDEGKGVLIPPASQSGSPQVTQSASRQRRPRFATAQDLDDALFQAIEGKITRKNAWVSKDASNLLEGITHAVESTLDAATSTDEYSSFAKVATVVEGCSKVWTSRVDSTYQRSNQMVRRLLRNEDQDENGTNGNGGGSDNEDGTMEGEGGSNAAAIAAAERRKKAAAQRRAQNVRTLALDPSEINLDSKGRVALVHTGVNAQFRAITEKFDQGNSHGLLVHNTPLGRAGNLILDVDYARDVDREYSARRLRLSSGGSRHIVKREINTDETNETDQTTTTTVTAEMGELDHGINMPIQLPPFPPSVTATTITTTATATTTTTASAGQSPLSAEEGGVGRQSGHTEKSEEEQEAGRPSIILPSLLLLPHTSSAGAEDVNTAGLIMGTGEEHQQDQQQQQLMTTDASLFPAQHNPSDYDDNDWGDGGGGGMDFGDDNYYDDDDHTNNNNEATSSTSNNNNTNNNGINSDVGENSDVINGNEGLRERIAAEAQQLVSGVAELNAMDGCLFGENRLALEAEDPTSWFPLSEPPTNVLLGGATHKNSELLRLHKEHRFTQTGTASQATSTPATKRVKREKTIAFDLPGELAATSAAAAASGSVGTGDGDSSLSSLSFLLNGNVVDSSALKQSTTTGKNMTQLGKELLLGKTPNTILAYTQGVFQRAKAQESGLLLAEPPVPGKTIPSYLPHPITVSAFFQPFSTSLLQWNLLRKSATGRTLGLHGSSAAPSRRASGVIGNNNTNNSNNNNNHHQGNGWGSKLEDDTQSHTGDDDGNGSGMGAVGTMPMDFFHGGAEADDDYMGAGGYDDYDDDDHHGGHADTMDPVRQAEAQILASFERSELARVSGALTAISNGRPSSHNNNINNNNNNMNELAGIEPLMLAKVLQAPQAALPSQVDVVKLRQAMWSSVSNAIESNPIIQEQQQQQEDQSEQHQQSSLSSRRKRGREEESHMYAAGEGSEELPRFSEVILPILPQISGISATGTLSPAFFFFSILFLANEHGVLLESVPELDDLVVRGVQTA